MPVQEGERRGRYKRHTDRVGKSGYKGVVCRRGRFVAQLAIKRLTTKEQINFHIGSYVSAEEAHKARIEFIESLK